jgi:hypothetical protein
MPSSPACSTCQKSGEVPTDFGPVDCPDCGGAGYLPSRAVLVDWRSRDLERALSAGRAPDAADVAWLLAELRAARGALTDIVALAHDLDDADAIAVRIRFAANGALGLYEPAQKPRAASDARTSA